MKPFNPAIFLLSTMVYLLLLFPSFICAGSKDEGMMSPDSFLNIFAWLFYLLRFPTHTLFWSTFSGDSQLFFFGLFLNCFFWGIVTERVFSIFHKRMKPDQ
jgi:hypothetical protein